MPADTLQIGSFAFEIDDLPEGIPLGGQQQVSVTKYPGGFREIQVFGMQEDTIAWSGVLNYTNAVDKMNQLNQLFKNGNVYVMQIGVLRPMNVVITKFKPTYRSQYDIPYDIELEIAPTSSLLIPVGAGSGNTSGGAAPTSPSSNAPAPQKKYTVRQGDSMWKIAARELGDGSRYREIATLNPQITNPNSIQVGQELVLPS